MSIRINSPSLDRPISLKAAFFLFTVALMVIAGLGTGIGYLFFWDKYENISKLEYDFRLGQANLEANPKSPQAHIDMGWVHVQNKEYGKALDEYKRALQLDPKNVAAKYNIALVQIEQKELGQAQKYLEDIKKQDKNYLNGRATLGYVYAERGDYKKALAEYEFVKTRVPGNADLYYQYGRVYEKMNEKKKAIESYRAALKYSPLMQEAKEALERLE